MLTNNHRATRGFTIVELVIVIVVIAILASISIVAYGAMSRNAQVSAVQSALTQANKKLGVYLAENDTYPVDQAAFNTLLGAGSSATTYQYSVNNTSNPKTYCITATNGTVSYKAESNATNPVSGGCAGHGVGGVAAITNLASDPRATAYSSTPEKFYWRNGRWAGSAPAAASYSLVTNALDGPVGISTYIRKTWTVAPTSITATGDTGFDNGLGGINAVPVVAGDSYTISCYVRPSVPRNFEIGVYHFTASGANYGTRARGLLTYGPAGQWTRLSYAYTVPAGAERIYITCDSQNSTANGAQNWSVGSTLDGTGLMVTKGLILYNYTDPVLNPNWVWNGTPGASTSTGPAL